MDGQPTTRTFLRSESSGIALPLVLPAEVDDETGKKDPEGVKHDLGNV
jgi:hypothetical protein